MNFEDERPIFLQIAEYIEDGILMDAQMPFGNIEEKPADKSFQPVDTRLKIFK
jgi:predicted oxidoreductase (fatty acid repression mutant protein)